MPRFPWGMWLINDSSLSDPPIHIVMTLRFMVTLSIGSPTRDSTRRYSLGHPKRLCCEVPAVHQGTGQGPDPKPRPKEEARGGHTCHGQPALWVLNHSDARVPCPLCPAAFVCSSSPSCSIQQPQDDLPSPAQAPKAPLRPAVKGQPARAASYRLISRPPFLQAWQQKKRGGPGPTGSLRPPAHKRAGDKDIFWDGRCWCRIPPGAWEAGERLGWVSWAGGQCRHAGQSPSGLRGRRQEPLAPEGGESVSELFPTPPRAGCWATPLTCQFKHLFFELTLFKHCSEIFTYFNLKGKNIKWSEYRPRTRTAQLDNEHGAKNTSVPGLSECSCSFRDHYQLKIHLKFHLAGQNSGCHHRYRCETKATLAFPGCVTVSVGAL